MMKTPFSLLLRNLRARFPALAIATDDGRVLSAFSSDAGEMGLLPQAIETVRGYFPMTATDLVLIQDPFLGGPGRDRLALVFCLRSGGNGEPALFAATTATAGSLRNLRLPPAPLRMGGELNPAVLEALGPARAVVLEAEKNLLEISRRIEHPRLKKFFDKKSLQAWDGCARAEWSSVFAELPEGDATVDLRLPTDEVLRARLHGDGKHLELDFSGTSAAHGLRLPLAATSGIVWSALRERLGLDPAVDSISPGFMPLLVPNGCFLNARSGDCTRGLDEGAAWLQWAVEILVQKWDRRKPRGLANPFDLTTKISFESGRILDLNLPTGSPAREDVEGTTFWRAREAGEDLSLETLERDWPVRVVRIDERVASSGKGRVAGGRGLHLQLELLAPASITWQPSTPTTRVKTERHQTAFDLSTVELSRDGEESFLPPIAPHTLRAGDVITLLSGSGGGIL